MPTPRIVIIGGGPAGEAASKTAIARGAEVLLIEKEFMGGLCLNWGCVPSKALLETVRKLRDARHGGPFGLNAQSAEIDWKTLLVQKAQIVAGLRLLLQNHLKTLGVQATSGEARFTSSNEIVINDKGTELSVRFDKAIIAGGTVPLFPTPFDSRRGVLLDNSKALELPSVPKSLVVVGGGAVGCEFACLFRELGAEVTIIEKTPGLVPGEDPHVVQALRNSFESRGIKVLTEATVDALSGGPGQWSLCLANGETLQAEQILVSIGRAPDLAGLALDKAGVDSTPRGITVNERQETNRPNIYAAGDVTGTSRLAHAAARQGEVAALNATGGSALYDGRLVPRCLYTWPEVASVGLRAYEAEANGMAAKTQRAFFKGSSTALMEGHTEGFVQVVSDKDSGKLLGAQIIGADASELIHIFSVALQSGMTAASLKSVIFAHPSLAETVREALSR